MSSACFASWCERWMPARPARTWPTPSETAAPVSPEARGEVVVEGGGDAARLGRVGHRPEDLGVVVANPPEQTR